MLRHDLPLGSPLRREVRPPHTAEAPAGALPAAVGRLKRLGLLACLPVAALALLATASPMRGQTLYKASAAVYVAGAAADVYVSATMPYGFRETNSRLANPDGTYNLRRGIAYKSLAVGAVLVAELLVLRFAPRLHKAFTIINFSLAGAEWGFAANNWSLRAARPAGVPQLTPGM